MKSLIFSLLFSFIVFYSPTILTENIITVSITVTDEEEKPLIGASVEIIKNETLINILTTDLKGQATVQVEEGTYDIRVTLRGYFPLIMEHHIFNEDNKTLELKLQLIDESIEKEISGFDARKYKKALDYDAPGISKESIASDITSRMIPASSVKIRGYSSVGKDGMPLPRASLPGSGQITAGEWNDLSNWKEWKKLVAEKDYNSMQSYWGINTLKRYSVVVINNNNVPLPAAKVILADKYGKTLWTSYSDVSGKAELWGQPFQGNSPASRITVSYQGSSKTLRQLRTVDQGSMMVTINTGCVEQINMDIAFVVDATSSMSDEIRYLQSELLDVINRVKSKRKDIRWSSVFYRDTDDEYVTRFQQFTEDHNKVLDFIGSQSAAGGGDFPEAVSEAIGVSVNDLEWNIDSEVKLCFLLLDAPPHEDKASMDKYKKHLARASEKGIKIIPVTASGINRETEFLMKFTAMMTNGTYVFITDDSGIGNAHLDPVVKDYKVEKLNDLMVRLITAYSRTPECQQIIAQPQSKALKYYPNPATSILNIENVREGDKIYVISTSGQIVNTHDIQSGGVNKLNIENLISGSYILRWVKEDDTPEDYSFLVIR